ncbi:uncharacterized protein TRIADDRAFT_54283 [Trichoplax adhaerens]|uniref:Proline-rich protein PRCC n=1 Tax=Trichoplax adhaerens TaxID=10228 RepID=B3RRL3_TRIAD|nr:hypothetical protein TRIADDRAFT_54283 [Trichoplax adhaerens]EDV26369.1 hypothetical protein TRIADDRAFT_54283 [Trichoplax adhaerens]|eukprot:XP_002110365.1 hypothetical protein TRIADDRAFT_54283 [Trichoplax adhaerens]
MIQKNKLDSIDNSKHSNFSKSNYLNSAPDPSLEEFEAPTYQNQTPIAGVSCSPEYTQGSQYQYNDHGNYNVNSYNSTYENSSQSNSSESNFVNELKQDEQFLRMQGKRKRGDAEIINIIDVNEADHIADAAKFRQKFSTEELSYRPEDSGRLKPSQMQKRKHQITYLAFQAKERELELKNTWSANRATRRQTQSKYGF